MDGISIETLLFIENMTTKGRKDYICDLIKLFNILYLQPTLPRSKLDNLV